jgi:hypothetical protein
MASTPSPADPLVALDHFLTAQAADNARGRAGDFDMNDEPDRLALASFPKLHEALDWLGANVTQPWQRADAAALVHQQRHSKLARTAIATGTGAIILAVLQLALKLSWPNLIGATFWLEAVTVLGGVVSVIVGLWAKADRNWLGQRHLAERLRMLKFRALARPELWSGTTEEWRGWVQNQLQTLEGAEEFRRVEDWSRNDRPEPGEPAMENGMKDATASAALVTYYRHKRLNYQGDYFQRKGAAAERQARWQRQLRLPLFFVTIGCVLFHFGADWLGGRMERAGSHEAARIWELVSLWGVVLAVVMPVYGIGVRAWTAAFEHARKARSFAAKHVAMQNAMTRLERDKHNLDAILGHMQHDELFLEQEHREWLRLLLDAEWFI